MQDVSRFRAVVTVAATAYALTAATLAGSAPASFATDPARDGAALPDLCSSTMLPTASGDRARDRTSARGEKPASVPEAQPGSKAAPSTARTANEAPSPALVRTVSVPGGMSPEMKSALQSLEALFSRSPESLQSTETQNGMKMLYLGGGLLNIHVARLNPDGTVTGECVSFLQDALRVMQLPDAARPASEPEER